MNKHFFVLGKNPALSTAEIIAVLKHQTINYSITDFSQEILVINTQQILEIDYLNKTLGGTVKMGKIINEVGLDEDETKFNQIFSSENLLENYFPQNPRKLHFGISIYNAGGNPRYVAQLEKRIIDFNLSIKQNLQEKGIKSGFLRIKERFLSSVSVFKNKLLTEGAEIIIIVCENEILIGKTLTVQEFASFSFRDYSRPARDKRSGIMPPKLARIMINLAQIGKEDKLLDPFCGSGTIVQEAVVLGYKYVIGSDISNKAVNDTKINIEWLFKQYPSFKKQNYNLKIICQDVNLISKNVFPQTINAIVTEPYLGPPFYKKPDNKLINKVYLEVSKLYISAFSQFAKILKSKGKIVIVFPVFMGNDQIHSLQIVDKIKELGFEKFDYIPPDIANNQSFFITSRNTIVFGDKEHFVQREILIFRKI